MMSLRLIALGQRRIVDACRGLGVEQVDIFGRDGQGQPFPSH